MISHFRTIRRWLITENKFSKYLIYAAGEIVLVIVGILIALQVNNGNETRKKEKAAIEILKQIQTDLAASVENADFICEFYSKKDSLAYLVLSERVTANDYLNNFELVYLTTHSENLIIKDYGFKKLDQYLEYMPKGTELLKKNLYYLYTDVKNNVEVSNSAITDEVVRTFILREENKSWAWKMAFSGSLDSEALNYFLTDPIYKNIVGSFCSIGSDNLCHYTKVFRTKAIQIYNEISEAIKSENSADTKIFPFYLDIDNYKNWTGKYRGNYNGDDITMEITIEDGTLFGQIDNNSKREIFPLSDTKFYSNEGFAFFSFIMNENKNITGIQYTHWQRCLIFNKIE